jgi:hypothetical protein
MMGAPQQDEVEQKLVMLDTLLSAFAGSVALIDLCRVIAQIEPSFFEQEAVGSYESVLEAVASGRNTLSATVWEQAERKALRAAARKFPADARGGRSASRLRRFDGRVRELRAELVPSLQARPLEALQVFESAALALKQAHYSRAEDGRGLWGISIWEVPDFGYQTLKWLGGGWMIG